MELSHPPFFYNLSGNIQRIVLNLVSTGMNEWGKTTVLRIIRSGFESNEVASTEIMIDNLT